MCLESFLIFQKNGSRGEKNDLGFSRDKGKCELFFRLQNFDKQYTTRYIQNRRVENLLSDWNMILAMRYLNDN